MELAVIEKKYAEKSVQETCEEYKGIYLSLIYAKISFICLLQPQNNSKLCLIVFRFG
jgi:hypothetical protein